MCNSPRRSSYTTDGVNLFILRGNYAVKVAGRVMPTIRILTVCYLFEKEVVGRCYGVAPWDTAHRSLDCRFGHWSIQTLLGHPSPTSHNIIARLCIAALHPHICSTAADGSISSAECSRSEELINSRSTRLVDPASFIYVAAEKVDRTFPRDRLDLARTTI